MSVRGEVPKCDHLCGLSRLTNPLAHSSSCFMPLHSLTCHLSCLRRRRPSHTPSRTRVPACTLKQDGSILIPVCKLCPCSCSLVTSLLPLIGDVPAPTCCNVLAPAHQQHPTLTCKQCPAPICQQCPHSRSSAVSPLPFVSSVPTPARQRCPHSHLLAVSPLPLVSGVLTPTRQQCHTLNRKQCPTPAHQWCPHSLISSTPLPLISGIPTPTHQQYPHSRSSAVYPLLLVGSVPAPTRKQRPTPAHQQRSRSCTPAAHHPCSSAIRYPCSLILVVHHPCSLVMSSFLGRDHKSHHSPPKSPTR